ncbi:unnamed protein product, partial [Pleuronectes platessa]
MATFWIPVKKKKKKNPGDAVVAWENKIQPDGNRGKPRGRVEEAVKRRRGSGKHGKGQAGFACGVGRAVYDTLPSARHLPDVPEMRSPSAEGADSTGHEELLLLPVVAACQDFIPVFRFPAVLSTVVIIVE